MQYSEIKNGQRDKITKITKVLHFCYQFSTGDFCNQTYLGERIIMPKYLAINSDFSGSPGAFYSHIQQHYYFAKKSNNNTALVIPYTVITDRNDVVMFNTSDLKLSAGFETKIEKKGFQFIRSLFKFNQIMQNSIFDTFFSLFSDLNVTPEELNLLPSIRAIYSLDKKFAYPIYFLVLPEDKPVKFKPKDNTNVAVYPYNDLIPLGLQEKSSDIMTKSVAFLIAVGELGIPVQQLSTTNED